jgi:hypothetical protein
MAMNTTAIRISSAAALCALLAVPAACSSDNNSNDSDASTGGETGTGGSSTGGAKATGGSGGAAKGGAGGTSTGGKGGSAGVTTTGGATGTPDGGPDATSPEAGTPDSSAPDAAPDGPVVHTCGAPADSSKAKLCLTFDPEVVTAIPADPRLDNKGVLVIQVFNPASATPTVPIQQIVYPPPPTEDGGVQEEIGIGELPPIDLDGLPGTVIISALFVDNNEFFSPLNTQHLLTYGMYVGGYDLAAGILPAPTPKPIPLTIGQGTLHSTSLTALRRFTTTVKYALLSQPVQQVLADDGQGPLSIGVFDAPAASGMNPKGGVRLGCKDITAGDIPATGFFYGTADRWLIGDLDDFNLPGLSQPGDVLSLGAGSDGKSAPDSQKITVSDQYSFTIPAITMNVVAPVPGTKPAAFHCP